MQGEWWEGEERNLGRVMGGGGGEGCRKNGERGRRFCHKLVLVHCVSDVEMSI